MDEIDEVKIERLEHCAATLRLYVASLKGEHEDLTGLGLRAIFCHQFEDATGHKIISQSHYDLLKSMAASGDFCGHPQV